MSAQAQLTGSDRLELLLTEHPLPSWRTFAWPVMVLLTALLTWSFFAQLDETAISEGQVVPQGKVKVIQHLEGGIIEQLFVAEGDTVKDGDRLLQLNLASTGANKEELQVRLDAQLLIRARLLAEAEGTELAFPDDVGKRRPTLVGSQRQAHDARKRELNSQMTVLKEQVKQK